MPAILLDNPAAWAAAWSAASDPPEDTDTVVEPSGLVVAEPEMLPLDERFGGFLATSCFATSGGADGRVSATLSFSTGEGATA